MVFFSLVTIPTGLLSVSSQADEGWEQMSGVCASQEPGCNPGSFPARHTRQRNTTPSKKTKSNRKPRNFYFSALPCATACPPTFMKGSSGLRSSLASSKAHGDTRRSLMANELPQSQSPTQDQNFSSNAVNFPKFKMLTLDQAFRRTSRG